MHPRYAERNGNPQIRQHINPATKNSSTQSCAVTMAYYAGRDNNRTGNWRPNTNNWTGNGDDGPANALAMAWAYYAMGNHSYRDDPAKVAADAAEKSNK
jgi:hypothetical protein